MSNQSWINAIIEEEKERAIKPISTGRPEIGCSPHGEFATNNTFVAAALRSVPAVQLVGEYAEFGKRLDGLRKNVIFCYDKRAAHELEAQKMEYGSEELRLHRRDTFGIDVQSLAVLGWDGAAYRTKLIYTNKRKEVVDLRPLPLRGAMALLEALHRTGSLSLISSPDVMKEFMGFIMQAHNLPTGATAFDWNDLRQFVPETTEQAIAA